MKWWLVELEPIKARYLDQWHKWFPEEMKRLGQEFEIISSKLSFKSIEEGRFLDIAWTNYFKAEQMRKIAVLIKEKRVKDDDIFFFYDGWHYGISVAESVMLGCIPVVPDRLAYQDFYTFRYKNLEEAEKLVETFIRKYDTYLEGMETGMIKDRQELIKKCESAISKIIEVVNKGGK